MPWTPTFWLTRTDFNNISDSVFEIESAEVYEFRLFRTDGVVICGPDTSRFHSEIHDVIELYEHYLLTSEPSCCDNGYSWGDELTRLDFL